jgi:hypothetical protein
MPAITAKLSDKDRDLLLVRANNSNLTALDRAEAFSKMLTPEACKVYTAIAEQKSGQDSLAIVMSRRAQAAS